MKRFSVWMMVALMASIGLAGCIDGSEPTNADVGPSGPEAQFGEDTGAIQGLVQTNELLPIPGAKVATQDESLSATTDEGGAFAISNVEPGQYQIFAAALGFEQVVQRVDVVAGSATQLNFVLDPVPTDGPFSIFGTEELVVTGILWKLTPECIYEPLTEINPLLKTCGGLRFAGCDACETHWDEDTVTPEWKTILVELDWEPQTGVTGRGFLMDLNAPNVTRGTGGAIPQGHSHTWFASSDEAPIVHRVDNPQTLEEREIPESDWYVYEDNDCTAPNEGNPNCDWFFRVFPAACDLGICEDGFGPDYGIMYEGRATVYYEIFMGEQAPAAYTNIPDV